MSRDYPPVIFPEARFREAKEQLKILGLRWESSGYRGPGCFELSRYPYRILAATTHGGSSPVFRLTDLVYLHPDIRAYLSPKIMSAAFTALLFCLPHNACLAVRSGITLSATNPRVVEKEYSRSLLHAHYYFQAEVKAVLPVFFYVSVGKTEQGITLNISDSHPLMENYPYGF